MRYWVVPRLRFGMKMVLSRHPNKESPSNRCPWLFWLDIQIFNFASSNKTKQNKNLLDIQHHRGVGVLPIKPSRSKKCWMFHLVRTGVQWYGEKKRMASDQWGGVNSGSPTERCGCCWKFVLIPKCPFPASVATWECGPKKRLGMCVLLFGCSDRVAS